MAFVMVLFRGEEVARRELNGPTVIGRAPDCDISVRDIVLSRHHCKILPVDGAGWAVEDLGSKNGTRIGGETVQYSVLKDGTSIRIGKTQVKFYSGSLSGAPAKPKVSSSNRRRPADPFEALSGTVSDFEFVPDKTRDLSNLPTPRPQPADPDAYADEDVYSMLTEIASSSWDSIYATASEPAAVMVAGQKPRRKLPVAGVKVAGSDLPPRRRNIVPDPSLQVDDSGPTKVLQSVPELAVPSPSEVVPPAPIIKPTAKFLSPVGAMLRRMKSVLTRRAFHRAS